MQLRRYTSLLSEVDVYKRQVVGTFGEATDSENYGIAIAKENTELLEKVNGALAEMKEDGFIDELTAKYFE